MKNTFPLLLAAAALAKAEPGLVPETPGTAPDYFCTWNVQGFACSYSNASAQADAMVEASLFGTGSNQNWLGFFPDVRGDLIFLLDDAFDFPLGGGHHHPARGSVELEDARFPSYRGPPAERLAKLNADVKARGWRGLGLWICNSRNRLPGLEKIESDDYWCERLGWSQAAGVLYWKVDWGIGERDRPLWKFKVTPRARAAAPDIWLEFGSSTDADVYRTYDVQVTRSIPETIRRIGAFLAKPDPKDHRIINCEDEVIIGAALGCHYGIMRHPLPDPMPNGKPDGFFPAHFRDVKRRMDEVTRAVRWHRIAQPLPKGDPFVIDAAVLSDQKSEPAPARIARGGLPLPDVTGVSARAAMTRTGVSAVRRPTSSARAIPAAKSPSQPSAAICSKTESPGSCTRWPTWRSTSAPSPARSECSASSPALPSSRRTNSPAGRSSRRIWRAIRRWTSPAR